MSMPWSSNPGSALTGRNSNPSSSTDILNRLCICGGVGGTVNFDGRDGVLPVRDVERSLEVVERGDAAADMMGVWGKGWAGS